MAKAKAKAAVLRPPFALGITDKDVADSGPGTLICIEIPYSAVKKHLITRAW